MSYEHVLIWGTFEIDNEIRGKKGGKKAAA